MSTPHRLLYDQSFWNLLTEPQNNNKQVALFILLLRVNSSFLVGEIFKRSCIICILKTTRVGMKVSNYHFSCYYANLGQFYRDPKKFFLRLIGYFCTQLFCFCYYGFDFLSRFLLETKESSIKLHGNRKGSNHIACEFPVCPQSKHRLSKNTLIFPTFAAAQNLHFLYSYLYCIWSE